MSLCSFTWILLFINLLNFIWILWWVSKLKYSYYKFCHLENLLDPPGFLYVYFSFIYALFLVYIFFEDFLSLCYTIVMVFYFSYVAF